MIKEAGLDVLSTGFGDMELRFKDTPIEIERAKRIITDMLKRGYALFIEENGQHKRVKRFDATKFCYIVADRPSTTAPTDADGSTQQLSEKLDEIRREQKPQAKPPKVQEKEIDAKKTKAIAVGRSAGG